MRHRRSRLTTRQEKPRDTLKDKLAPLKSGFVVKLQMTIERAHGKHNVRNESLILLTPGVMYGMPHGTIVVAVIGKGSCVINPIKGTGKGELSRAGVPHSAVVALFEKLSEIYGDTHGTSPSTEQI